MYFLKTKNYIKLLKCDMQGVAISLTACVSSAKEPSPTYDCDVIVTLFQGKPQTDTKGRARRIFV